MTNKAKAKQLNRRMTEMVICKRKLQVVFLSGAGGVGKTSVVEAMKFQLEATTTKANFTISTTRKSYETCGVRDEAHCASLSTVDKIRLQNQIFTDYCENLRTEIVKAVDSGVDLLVVDRSPFDHASYMFNLIPDLVLEFVARRVQEAKDAFTPATCTYYSSGVITEVEASLWFFAYPTAWAKLNTASDGFRYVLPAKNFIWSAALNTIVLDYLQQPGNENIAFNTFEAYDDTTPHQRGTLVLRSLGISGV